MPDLIAIQGECGAFSNMVALKIFPNAKIKFCSTFEEAFQSVKDNPKYKIVIPVENNLSSRVADVHYLIPKYKLQIHSEFFQQINHNLLGVKGSKFESIKSVRSHIHALDQCRNIIIKNKWISNSAADTAGSAKFIAEKNDKTEAAIASELAAKIYNLQILKSNIEDQSGNFTRFFVMGNQAKHPIFSKDKKFITSIVFRVKSIPAALYLCLSGFAVNKINLTRLESFSEGKTFDQTNFFCDLEGHIEDLSVKNSLEVLGSHTKKLDILGVYDANPFRFKN